MSEWFIGWDFGSGHSYMVCRCFCGWIGTVDAMADHAVRVHGWSPVDEDMNPPTTHEEISK